MKVEQIKERFSYKQLEAYNSQIRSKYNGLKFQYDFLIKKQEQIIEKEVKQRTEEYEQKLEEKNKIITEKEKEIEVLKSKIAHMASKMNNDSSNSGIPTSKTPLGKKKYIPNTREKSDKKSGGQVGHKKHKLKGFTKEEANEIITIRPKECPYCGEKEIKELETETIKCETDYEVKVIKRIYEFKDCECPKCHKVFREKIPKELKEENQYGPVVQSLCVCLTNEIYTPFNKTSKLISGITKNEINLSEGYIIKLQARASEKLKEYIKESKEYITKEPVYGWDEGIISINEKNGILRTYCTDKVALFYASESKSKDSIDENGILPNTNKETIVMHDHVITNYHEDYCFENVECMIHLKRRIMKMEEQTHHEYLKELAKLLSKTVHERNEAIEKNQECFEKEYIEELHRNYRKLIEKGQEENEKEPTTVNYFKEEEKSFLKDLLKYEDNYLKWADRFDIPTTNNNSEKNIRPVKSKMKISGQFQKLKYAEYYATIRSYIETCKKNGINIIDACVQLMIGEPYSLTEILDFGMQSSKRN